MLGILIKKEFLNQVYSFRFIVSSVLCILLILISVFVLKEDYLRKKSEFDANQIAYRKQVEKYDNFHELQIRGINVSRPLENLQIFYSGLEKNPDSTVNIIMFFKPSFSGDFNINPVISLFPCVDLLFVVSIVMSLLAFVFSYDAISGERELGTLKLLMSYSIPRDKVILAKWIGGFASLVVPYLIAIFISVILILFSGEISFSGQDWSSFFLTICVSVIFIAAMYSLGLLVSARCKQSNTSISILLFIWVVFVLIIPNISPFVADQIRPIPSKSVMESQIKYEMGSMVSTLFKDLETRGRKLLGMEEEEDEIHTEETREPTEEEETSQTVEGQTKVELPEISERDKMLKEIEEMGCEAFVEKKIEEYKDKLPEGMKVPDEYRKKLTEECEKNREMLKGLRLEKKEITKKEPKPKKPKKTQQEMQKEMIEKIKKIDPQEIRKFQEYADKKIVELSRQTSSISEKRTKEYDRKVAEQVNLTKYLSRISPVASYVYAVTDIAGTGIRKEAYLMKSLSNYQYQFNKFIDSKINAPFEKRTRTVFYVFTEPEYDLTDMPVFKYAPEPLVDRLVGSLIDILLLCIYVVVFFLITFLLFLRMDIID